MLKHSVSGEAERQRTSSAKEKKKMLNNSACSEQKGGKEFQKSIRQEEERGQAVDVMNTSCPEER